MSNTISPGVLLANGKTWYPSGREWLLAFAIAGFVWAITALEALDKDKFLGEGI